MANHASAKKRIRQTEKRTVRNRGVRSAVRSSIKRCREAIAQGKPEPAREALHAAARRIDMAVSKGVYHHKTGARYISRLATQVAQLK